MDPKLFNDCWFLTGPTASGKTTIGLELAQSIDAEIISLDSMAVYRQLDISTAKPTPEQQSQVRHHLLDVVDPNENYALSSYIEAATATVNDIRNREKQPLFIGGTPLYLKSLLRGLDEGPPPIGISDARLKPKSSASVSKRCMNALNKSILSLRINSIREMYAGSFAPWRFTS